MILFVDELHRIMFAGGGFDNPAPAAQMLKPALARGEVSMIGATTTDEYRQIEKDPAMERRMQPIKIDPLGVAATVEILKHRRSEFEDGGIRITDEALEAAAELTDRYLPSRKLPDKAIDALDEAAADLRTRAYGGTLTAAEIATAVEEMSGVPVGDPEGEDMERLANLEQKLSSRVKGQGEALTAVSGAIRRKRVGLAAEERPVSAIFAGPTGVGKTELAKALAEALFGDERAMIRLDMSEYGERHEAARLTGAPPGYIGHEEGGQLTESVRRKPHSVILFDEIEKAHPKVLDVLLQILGDGRLTDSAGRTVDFTSAVVLLTTNLGTQHVLGAAGGSVGETRMREELVREGMRPELVNRLGAVCAFRSLPLEQVKEIAASMLDETRRRLLKRSISMTYTDAAAEALAASGYSVQFGARELARALQDQVEQQITQLIYSNQLAAGNEVAVDAGDLGKLSVEVVR